MKNCSCGNAKPYLQCCGLYISGKAVAPTPEALMRSRYSAYTRGNMNYIARTMKGAALEEFDLDSAAAWAQSVRWLKLEVLRSQQSDTQGFVEFIAHFVLRGTKDTLHEVSEFKLFGQEWFYVDGRSQK